MKVLRIAALVALVLGLMLSLSFPAAAAKLPVPVDLTGSGASVGANGYKQILPNGTVVNPYVLPANKTLIINSMYIHYSPGSTPGPYYFSIVSGGASTFFKWGLVPAAIGSGVSLSETVNPGIAFTVLPVMQVEDANGNPITDGDLKVRFFGIVQ